MERDLSIEEVTFSARPLCFKRDCLNQVRGDDDDDDDDEDKDENFDSLSPTISLREAKRPPRTGGGAISSKRPKP